MNCMKCGRAIGEQGAFCKTCLAVMAQYPVKPEAKVVMPGLRVPRRPSRPQRKQRTSDEIIAAQRRKIRRLYRAVILLTLFLMLCIGAITWQLYHEQNTLPLGSNYSTTTEPVSRETVSQS